MTWDMVKEIASSRYGRIEAHTTNHMALSQQSEDEVLLDVQGSFDRINAETGYKPRHFAYPYGDAASMGPRDIELIKSLPFNSAVTTKEAVLQRHHRSEIFALPRLEVNGQYQSDDYLGLLLQGVAPYLKVAS